MKLVFDMDGVLRTLDLATIHICETLKDFDAAYVDSITATRPLLNPIDFALPDDEIYCLTRCMDYQTTERKRLWLKHYYGDRVKLLPVMHSVSGWGKPYCEAVGKMKYDILMDIGADVYFDDDPGIIKYMRELADKDENSHIKFFKYGPWIEEYKKE